MTAQALAGTAAGYARAAIESLALPVWITGDATGEAVAPPAALAFLSPHVRIGGTATGASAAALTGIGLDSSVTMEAAGGSLADLVTVALGTGLALAVAGSAEAQLAGLYGTGGVLSVPELQGVALAGAAAACDLTVAWFASGDAGGGSAAACSFAFPLPLVRDPIGDEYPGTVNLVLNPSLEYGTAGGWSGTSLARDAAVGWSGGASARVSRTGAGSVTAAVTTVEGLGLSGQAFAGQVMVASDVAGTATAALAAIGGAGEAVGTASEPVTLSGTGGWARLTCWVAGTEGVGVERLELRISGLLDGTGQVWLDGAQIEADRGYRETQYADGDAGDGCRWSGEPGASVSVREPR